MNERMAQAGNQLKQAFQRVVDAWKNLEASRKKQLLMLFGALVVVALGIVIALNMVGGRYVVVYKGLSTDEATRAVSVLQASGISARTTDDGSLLVQSKNVDAAIGQLAIQGIPSSTLDYNILESAGGLTTTDFEKQQYQINQLQNRLQDIIRTYDGVSNAYVTLNLGNTSNRVWDSATTQSSAGVKVTLYPGNALTAGQVAGIRYLVGSSVGIDPSEVSVIDSDGTVIAAAGDDYDMSTSSTQQFLMRQGFESEVERRIAAKVANILSLPYPNASDFRIEATAVIDYDAMITESMQYSPYGDTDHGVADHEDYQAALGLGQYAQGVVGEDQNTDIPTYADLNGDGEADMVDYYMNRDYLVSYIKQQVEKDGAKLESVSIAVMIRGALTNETRLTLRELISAATNVPVENISVQGLAVEGTQAPGVTEATLFGLPVLFWYIAAAAFAALILIMVVILVLRGRAKKKTLAEAEAAAAAEQEEEERVQREIEERRKQLIDAARGDVNEDAIGDEVRQFAHDNPEITANLLRNWLKEGE